MILNSLDRLKLHEETPLEVDKMFQELIEGVTESILIIGPGGKIEHVNECAEEMFGYSNGELIDQTIEVLLPERFRNSHVHQRQQYIDHPIARPMGRNKALYGRRKCGEEFAIDISLTPLETNRGFVTTAFIRDVSAFKKIEMQQRLLADASAVLAETVDYDDRINRLASVAIPSFCDICIVQVFEGSRLVTRAIAGVDTELLNSVLQGRSISSLYLDESFGTDEVLKCFQIQSYITAPMQARGKRMGVILFAHKRPKKYSAQDLAFAELFAGRSSINIDNGWLYSEAKKQFAFVKRFLQLLLMTSKIRLVLLRALMKFLAMIAAKWTNTNTWQTTLLLDRFIRWNV
ncbi:MAG: hypothetical protein A2622_04280 [Bdellovibrionales bacterium RIFCSPHIGHO2_01_FULL_40_29]|nr:MAG: hypothetical protein A2622_04280 [Bdellovibrionales bacterium RIFCSPHIGHO2_01_FULL_40_29]OFZ34844.1 MAG: hypothetical protein A3D17_11095 [Bdellovibrionales bacterium RIFCSPHIGHO2_02_FULL_40_15]